MSLIDRWLRRGGEQQLTPNAEERSSTLGQPSRDLMTALGVVDSYSGKAVTVDTALQLVPVYSAVSLLAGAVGSLPLIVYRRLERGRERADNHRMWSLLHDAPNPRQAADEVWEWVMASLALWGNAFLAKEDMQTIRPSLWPLDPKRITVGEDEKGIYYLVSPDTKTRYRSEHILHIRGLGANSLVGYSPIQMARQSLGNAMAQEEYQGRFWRNDARPGGVLVHPNELSDKAARRLKKSWREAHEGVANAAKVAILEEGLSWQNVSVPMADAQFIEQANLSRSDVALLFRIPPYMMATETGGSLDYSTSEMAAQDFVKWSLRRWLVRIESAVGNDTDLFGQKRIYPEFLIDALLRADTATRFKAYEAGWNKWLTTNEIREAENLSPVTDGDVLKPELAQKAAQSKGDNNKDSQEGP